MPADASGNSTGGDNSTCPYCGKPMKRGHFLIGGNVLFAESTVALSPLFASTADIERMLENEETKPPHVIVSGKGYQAHPEYWPKPGMFCQDCLAITMKIRN